MNNAKSVYILSNGEIVELGNKVQITLKNSNSYIGNIVGIGETFITIELADGSGDCDSYFSELKDVSLVK